MGRRPLKTVATPIIKMRTIKLWFLFENFHLYFYFHIPFSRYFFRILHAWNGKMAVYARFTFCPVAGRKSSPISHSPWLATLSGTLEHVFTSLYAWLWPPNGGWGLKSRLKASGWGNCGENGGLRYITLNINTSYRYHRVLNTCCGLWFMLQFNCFMLSIKFRKFRTR